MKATSLSINLYGGCDARCPFCIASATWKTGVRSNRRLETALPKALDYARYHGVDTVLVTGSGEPTLHRGLVLRVAREARRLGIPAIELQTNGAAIAADPTYLGELAGHGFTTVALSVASVESARSAEIMGIDLDYLDLAADLDRLGFLCRVSLNLQVGDRAALRDGLPDFAERLAAHGVRQLTLRELGVPERPEGGDEAADKIAWVRANALPAADVERLEREVVEHGSRLRSLSYGATVYDYHGLSVVVTTCMSDRTSVEEIRSFILQPDGHVYHSWNYRGSVLI
jgi:molybdenum cofactor biosynthesis enzyme MoaA